MPRSEAATYIVKQVLGRAATTLERILSARALTSISPPTEEDILGQHAGAREDLLDAAIYLASWLNGFFDVAYLPYHVEPEIDFADNTLLQSQFSGPATSLGRITEFSLAAAHICVQATGALAISLVLVLSARYLRQVLLGSPPPISLQSEACSKQIQAQQEGAAPALPPGTDNTEELVITLPAETSPDSLKPVVAVPSSATVQSQSQSVYSSSASGPTNNSNANADTAAVRDEPNTNPPPSTPEPNSYAFSAAEIICTSTPRRKRPSPVPALELEADSEPSEKRAFPRNASSDAADADQRPSLPELEPTFSADEVARASTPRRVREHLASANPAPRTQLVPLALPDRTPTEPEENAKPRPLPKTRQIARRMLQLGVAHVASEAELRVLYKWARVIVLPDRSVKDLDAEGLDPLPSEARARDQEQMHPQAKPSGKESGKTTMWRGSRWGA